MPLDRLLKDYGPVEVLLSPPERELLDRIYDHVHEGRYPSFEEAFADMPDLPRSLKRRLRLSMWFYSTAVRLTPDDLKTEDLAELSMILGAFAYSAGALTARDLAQMNHSGARRR